MVTRSRSTTKSDSRDRGQLLLIGAITIALIVIGVVIVFNGVLFTETLSTSSTSQTASDAGTIEAEITQGIKCDYDPADVDEFIDHYQHSKLNSEPVVLNFEDDINPDDSFGVEYNSNDVSYTLEIDLDCE